MILGMAIIEAEPSSKISVVDDESISSHLASVETIADLLCSVQCQELELNIYDHKTHVMSILSEHITDVYRLC